MKRRIEQKFLLLIVVDIGIAILRIGLFQTSKIENIYMPSKR